MDRHVRRLLNRVSLALAAIATVSLLHLFRHSSASCFAATSLPSRSQTQTLTLALTPFPRTSCDAASRRLLPPDLRLVKLRSSPLWRRRGAALATAVFAPLRLRRLLANSSRVLCLAAGAGHAVDALRASGVGDVTGVDLLDFPPLVRRADPHNLPFFDGVFDLAFSDDPAGLAGALFPARFAGEVERTVRRGGALALAVDRHLDPTAVAALFKRSRIVEVRNVTLNGSEMSMVILRNNGTNTNPH